MTKQLVTCIIITLIGVCSFGYSVHLYQSYRTETKRLSQVRNDVGQQIREDLATAEGAVSSAELEKAYDNARDQFNADQGENYRRLRASGQIYFNWGGIVLVVAGLLGVLASLLMPRRPTAAV